MSIEWPIVFIIIIMIIIIIKNIIIIILVTVYTVLNSRTFASISNRTYCHKHPNYQTDAPILF